MCQQSDKKLPKGFIRDEDLFAIARKELVEEIEQGELRDGDIEENGNPGQGGLKDGEVDERRLLKVLGKDLKGITGAL